jgi:hypothetical protein
MTLKSFHFLWREWVRGILVTQQPVPDFQNAHHHEERKVSQGFGGKPRFLQSMSGKK